MNVPGLRSPFDRVGGIVYFARMLDKIRLDARGGLPADYQPNLGRGFDSHTAKFLRIPYDDLRRRVLEGGTDEEILEWSFTRGHRPGEEEIEVWNGYMQKFGWNDDASPALRKVLSQNGLPNRPDIQTVFDYIDADEGRPPHQRKPR